jgi:antitoxin VapB
MLTITRPEADELARTVAARTGLSIDDAVTDALKEKLARLDEARAKDIETRMAEIRRIQQQVKDLWGEPLPTQAELDADMYDEYGAPK